MKNVMLLPRSLIIAVLLAIPAVIIVVMSVGMGATQLDGSSDEVLNTDDPESNAILLKRSAKNMRDAESYTLNDEMNLAGLAIMTKSDLAISSRTARIDTYTPNANGEIILYTSLVAIGETGYLSTDSGQNFTEIPAVSVSGFTMPTVRVACMWNGMTDDEIDRIKDELKNGIPATETIDGTLTKHMTGDLKSLSALNLGADSSSEGTFDIWVTINDPSYVRQVSIVMKSPWDLTETFKWSSFNKEFRIEAPFPGSLQLGSQDEASKDLYRCDDHTPLLIPERLPTIDVAIGTPTTGIPMYLPTPGLPR